MNMIKKYLLNINVSFKMYIMLFSIIVLKILTVTNSQNFVKIVDFLFNFLWTTFVLVHVHNYKFELYVIVLIDKF